MRPEVPSTSIKEQPSAEVVEISPPEENTAPQSNVALIKENDSVIDLGSIQPNIRTSVPFRAKARGKRAW